MRLVNYGVGEIVDRLTILDLKIAHGGGDHFATERSALLTQLHGRTLNGAWFEHALRLAVINGLLWRAEDDLRGARKETPIRSDRAIVEIAFQIQELNDQRAGCVQTINKLTGDHLGSEKL